MQSTDFFTLHVLDNVRHGGTYRFSCDSFFCYENFCHKIIFYSYLTWSDSEEGKNYKNVPKGNENGEGKLTFSRYCKLFHVHHIVYDIWSIFFYDSPALFLFLTRMVQCHLENLSKCLLRIWHLMMMLLLGKKSEWSSIFHLFRLLFFCFLTNFNMKWNGSDYCSHISKRFRKMLRCTQLNLFLSMFRISYNKMSFRWYTIYCLKKIQLIFSRIEKA